MRICLFLGLEYVQCNKCCIFLSAAYVKWLEREREREEVLKSWTT